MAPPDSGGDPPDGEKELATLRPEEARALLARSLRLDSSGGRLEWFGDRHVLIRPALLVNLQRQMEQTVGASTKGILYLAGEKSGKEGVHEIPDLLRGFPLEETPFETAKRMADILALAGWGRFEVGSLDVERRRGVITLENSAIAEMYGPSKKPVCHLLAGWIAGIASRLFGTEILCEEAACRAQGKDRCEFQLQPMPTR